MWVFVRFTMGSHRIRKADVYISDEPRSNEEIREELKAKAGVEIIDFVVDQRPYKYIPYD